MKRTKYRKREQQVVTGVQLNLDTDGFKYNKWGGLQLCRAGDWLLDNNGECYTIGEESFRKTYEEISPGRFVKTAAVWAIETRQCGSVKTNEGYTEYVEGDYLVANNEDGSDAYAVSKEKFEQMYERIE